MAKAVITIVDEPDGTVKINAEFDPPMKSGVVNSAAQTLATQALKAMSDSATRAGGGQISRRTSQRTDGFRRR